MTDTTTRPIDEQLAAELNRVKPIVKEQAAEIERLRARNAALCDALADAHDNSTGPDWDGWVNICVLLARCEAAQTAAP